MIAVGFRLVRSEALIGGKWVAASDGRAFEVSDPSDNALVASVADCTADDATRAIEAAQEAFPGWRAMTALARGRVLRRWFDLIIAHTEDLAALLAREQGKPLAEARAEIAYGASFVEWFADEARRVDGDIVPSPVKGGEILVLKEPIGVVAAITPWNFPNAMITRKVAPALAAGCAAVVKPAAETPLSALALGVLAQEAGLPPGVLNIIPSTRAQDIGAVFTRHPMVRKISFTGSTAVGRLIIRDSAETIKKLSLELGGNAPFIVFDDADLAAAVAGAIASKFRNSGQTCVCANRFYVQSSVYDEFAARLVKAAAALIVGGAFEPGVEQGPLISHKALLKVEALVEDARARGARFLLGGARHARGGTFYEPTVLSEVPPDALLLREEIFGPVAPLVRFGTEAEAVALANAGEFGLASYFYARDLGRVFRVARAIEAGMVAVNEGILSTVEAPFGGVKQSGIGREGSRYGIEDYLELKYVCLGGLSD